MKKEEKIRNAKKEIEMVPPEGGWGYMICIALVLMFMGSANLRFLFGLLFNDFINSVGGGTKEVAVMQTMSSILSSTGVITMSAILNKYSLRQVGLAGASMVVFGSFMLIWVSNMYELVIYYVMIDVGLDIQILVTYTAFNSYFDKKRIFLLNQCNAIVGLIFMIAPIVAEWSLSEYGFRGTLMLFAAFNSHTLLAMVMLQPVKDHMVPKKLSEQHSDALPIVELQIIDHKIASFPEEDVDVNLSNEKEASILLLSKSDSKRMAIPIAALNHEERKASMPQRTNKLENMDLEIKKSNQNHLYAGSMLSLGRISEANEAVELPLTVDKKGRLRMLLNFLDLSLLKDKIYLNITIGIAFVIFTEMSFVLLFPLMLFDYGYSKDNVAICLSAHAGGDMAARFLLAAFSRFFTVKPRYIFYCGAAAEFILRTVLFFFHDWRAVATTAALIGIGKCLTNLTLPLILADHVQIEKYPAAYGLYMVMSGTVNAVFGPIIGVIRDLSRSYFITIQILNGLFLVCVIPWMVEFIRNKNNAHSK